MTNTAGTTTGNSAMGALFAMFYEPSKTFASLESKRHAWLPLVLVMLSTCALLMWYFSVVDFSWMIDQMNAGIKDAAVREKAAGMMTRGVLQTSALVASLVMIPLVTVVMGVYFMLVAKSMGKEFGFGAGFALSAWSGVTSLLLLPLGGMQILLSSNHQIASSELNPLSLNQLFFHYGMDNKLAGPLDMVSLTTIWGMILMVIGFQAWAKVSRSAATAVVVIPYAVIFAGWFGFAMMMSKAV
ncbi:MAG: YIP1 family protein [Pseudomonadota bacterium]